MGAAFLAGFIFVSFGSTFPETEAEFEKLLVPENIFLIAVAVPFIEELIYRSWLGWRWGVTILMPIVLIPTTFALIQASEGQVNQGFISLTLIALMIYFTLLFRRMSEPGFLESFTQRLFPVAFWATTLVFALIHLGNYDMSDGTVGPLIIIMVLPQIVAGVIFAYARMRFGFLAAFLLHGAHNATILTLGF